MPTLKDINKKLDAGRQYRDIKISNFTRRAEDDGEKIVEGYATVFDTQYELYHYDNYYVFEQISPDAFADCDMRDVIMQYDHAGRVFARISNNTLTVAPDATGLFVRAKLGGTELGRQLYEEIDGGYTTKMSFGFVVAEDKREVTEDHETGVVTVVRTITKISKLFDVSAVSLPANDATSISARNYGEGVIAEIREELEKRKARERQQKIIRILREAYKMFDFSKFELNALEARRAEIAEQCSAQDADLDALEAEIRAINEEIESRKAAEAKRVAIRKAVAAGDGKTVEKVDTTEERNTMTEKEIRSSKAYIDAYADYIKNKNDDGRKCRELLSKAAEYRNANLTTMHIPVPIYLEERIETAWENDEILRRVTKSYIKGNLRVGVEIDATPAVTHEENDEAPDQEELTIAVVDIAARNVKKWIVITDEVVDLKGEAFLDYLYDEFTYQIIKAAAGQALEKIMTAPRTITGGTSKPIISAITKASGESITGADIIKARGLVHSSASDLVLIASPDTISEIRINALSANFYTDPFEGLTVIPYEISPIHKIKVLIGDLKSVRANFPNGEDIKFIFDPYTYAEQDLVKIVGRMFVGFGYVRNKHFAVIEEIPGENPSN